MLKIIIRELSILYNRIKSWYERVFKEIQYEEVKAEGSKPNFDPFRYKHDMFLVISLLKKGFGYRAITRMTGLKRATLRSYRKGQFSLTKTRLISHRLEKVYRSARFRNLRNKKILGAV